MARAGVLFALFAVLVVAQTIAPAGAPPAEVPSGVAATLQQDGIRITDGSKLVAEFWFCTVAPSGPKSAEEAVTLTTIPGGALLGVVRVPARFADRLGAQLKAGVYLLRYGAYPADGAHQGAEPQRDFLVLTPVGDDKNPGEALPFPSLMETSKKASGGSHPAVLSMWRVDSDFKAGIAKVGDAQDWVLQTMIGEVPVAVIVVGKNGH
jgi:hypothetical protein